MSRFYRDLPWVSATVTLGYHCQGIFRYRADGTGVNAVDRSADQQLLVSADEIGQLNLFRYPCVKGETPVASNRRSFSLTPRPRSAVDGWATGRRPRPIASALSPSAASISLSCNGGALLCRTRRPRPSRRPDRRRSVPPNGADRTSAPCPRTRAASLREIPERHRRLREDRPSCKRNVGFV